MNRPILALMLPTLLGACGLSGQDRVASVSLDRAVQPARAPISRDAGSSAELAIATLPSEAGRIAKITSQPFPDGIRQTIAYDGVIPGLKPGQINLSLRTATRLEPGDGPAIALYKPTEAAIRAELASEFPTMEMRIVDPPRSNAYGVYGLAAGKWANGAACIYAWQWLERLDALDTSDVAAPVSLRVRYCRMGATPNQLASLIDGIRLDLSRRPGDVQAGVIEQVAKSIEPPQPSPPKKQTGRSRPQLASLRPAKPAPATQAVRRIEASADAPAPALDPTLPAAAFRGPLTVARSNRY
ncbi:MAG: cellulose biosynthesis protein BcsN [Rhodopseudomonas sp.]|uniref:cellulose biosynthesis protein BcsN n=1 Tax=Rhodopseudomonas sp. TaxID=1078 RepID=UPI00181551AA|nr:cellulose biosynthesis protein BcsN [Rhodopseudomonas sp.]NVN86933.1 cellulose biosynthesis protein BcsN [Rhodopseudomonas sp.]